MAQDDADWIDRADRDHQHPQVSRRGRVDIFRSGAGGTGVGSGVRVRAAAMVSGALSTDDANWVLHGAGIGKNDPRDIFRSNPDTLRIDFALGRQGFSPVESIAKKRKLLANLAG